MSKLGKKPIVIPQDVKIECKDKKVKIIGPKGQLELSLKLDCDIIIKDNLLKIISKRKDKFSKSLFGQTRAEIQNMIIGTKEGFSKVLELVGVGFRAKISDAHNLILNLGFSHPVEIQPEPDIEISVEKNKIRISGIDKQKVGQMAANIRKILPPEPYKGKGIRYENEEILRKPGKVIAKTVGQKEI